MAPKAPDNSSSRPVAKQNDCPETTLPAAGPVETPSNNKDVLVVCELIYFVVNTMDKHPLSTIKSVIHEFYRDDEILSAKQKLVSVLPEAVKELSSSQFTKNRIGTNKMKASVDDIISIILCVVDENNLWDSLPTFCAASRSRVPDIPDELSDIAAIRYELKQVREQLECLTLKFMSAGVSESAMTDEKHTTDDLSTPLNDDSCSSLTARDTHPDNHCLSARHNDHATSTVTQLPEAVVAQSAADKVASYAEAAERNRENAYQVVSYKKPAKKRQLVIGRSTDNTLFKGVVKKAVVCVNRLDPAVTTDVVSNFLKDNGVNVYSCYIVKNKQVTSEIGDNNQSIAEPVKEVNFISMRLCVSYSDLEKVYDTNLWPDGIVVRPWSFKSKTKSDGQS